MRLRQQAAVVTRSVGRSVPERRRSGSEFRLSLTFTATDTHRENETHTVSWTGRRRCPARQLSAPACLLTRISNPPTPRSDDHAHICPSPRARTATTTRRRAAKRYAPPADDRLTRTRRPCSQLANGSGDGFAAADVSATSGGPLLVAAVRPARPRRRACSTSSRSFLLVFYSNHCR